MESFSFTFTIFHPQNVVQIVYLPKHWLMVSTVGCSPGTVKVKYFSTGNEEVLATLLSNTYSEITVVFVKCSQQNGGTACGTYAADHATLLYH